jgi:anaerobic magnesium-protoporphyrin IX monomethyl ester cyclase
MAAIISPARLRRKSHPIDTQVPVLLVNPPSPFLLDERVFMTLGILKVGAVLEQAGAAVEMLDLSGIDNYLDALDVHLRSTTARIVGITTTTPQLPAVVKIAERARMLRPDLRLVLGGPHVTLVCAAVKLEHKAGRVARAHQALAELERRFDVLVAGDGEFAVFEAISPNPPKIVDGDDHHGPLFMSHADYENTPWPARHLVDVSSYHYTVEGRPAASLIAQLGCSMQCVFCGGRASKALRVIRTRSVESVVAEIEHLHETYGFTGFNFFDDELNLTKMIVPTMRAIDALQKRLGVSFRLRGFIKAELFTDEQAEAMVAAGFRWILCGFEAASPRILENIRKQATIEDNTRVVEICRRRGLKVKALMSVGHAGESEESIRAVRDWLLDVKPDDFDCTVITTYPGTPYYDEALPHETLPDTWTYTCKKSGDRLHSIDVDYTQVSDYYKGDPQGGYISFVFTDYLSSEQIVEMRDALEHDVRKKLNIPFNPSAVARNFEHSMGQGALPPYVLRTSRPLR